MPWGDFCSELVLYKSPELSLTAASTLVVPICCCSRLQDLNALFKIWIKGYVKYLLVFRVLAAADSATR